ncbi:MAG: HD domain-containing protein, partial [Acidobacteriia bacterium]|nr:HD domain-containing protein [Terriglobia bacterium]
MTYANVRTKIYILAVSLLGLASLITHSYHFHSTDPVRFSIYLVIVAVCSGLKVSLPGIKGTMSVSYVIFLLGFIQLSLSETLVMGLVSTLVQSVWHAKQRPKPVQVVFNIASIAIAITGGYAVYHSPLWAGAGSPVHPLALVTAACGYFLLNTLSIALVVGLSESKSSWQVWKECYFWSFPYYLLGASITGAMDYFGQYVGWEVSVLVLPLVYVIYRSYGLYLDRLEGEKNHAQQMASLHLRTIEALALAIEAMGDNTHEHLYRVQVYATEIGKEMGLSQEELSAIQAAAILHDIGKLAVPDYIISKPGKLTPEEFEKMKIHPVVGAEILERVQFPYPVVPIVRSHHEKWDGSGYPDGLKGEQIPIGARILSTVDCLDAVSYTHLT